MTRVTREEHLSQSRVRRMTACPRQEWYYTAAADGGWRADASPETREAYALRCATSLDAALGQAIHEAAASLARAIRDGRRSPTYDELVTLVRGRLGALWRATDASAFRRAPRRNEFLVERLLGREITQDDLARIRIRLPALTRRLVQHPVWESVRQCGRGDVHVIEALDAMRLEFDGDPVRIYCAPDLLYVSRAAIEVPGLGLPVPAGTPVLVDWKSGRTGEAVQQLGLYALYVRDHLRIAPGVTGYLARIGDLQTTDEFGGEAWLVGDVEIEQARTTMLERFRQLRRWFDAHGRLDRDRMPRVETACRFCAFTPLCGPESPAPIEPRDGQ